MFTKVLLSQPFQSSSFPRCHKLPTVRHQQLLINAEGPSPALSGSAPRMSRQRQSTTGAGAGTRPAPPAGRGPAECFPHVYPTAAESIPSSPLPYTQGFRCLPELSGTVRVLCMDFNRTYGPGDDRTLILNTEFHYQKS